MSGSPRRFCRLMLGVTSAVLCTVSASCRSKLAPVATGRVVLIAPASPMYVGSYARVIVPNRGVPFDHLQFRVREGPQGGVVSESQDSTFDAQRPDVMLVAGYKPGRYTLEAVDTTSGTVVGTTTFDVTVSSPGGRLGPSFVSQASVAPPSGGSAWGGGPAGLQNVATNPARATQRIALIFVDTNDELFTTNVPTLNGFRQRWRQNIADGFTIGTVVSSVRRYYEETSNSRTAVTVALFGPYHLGGTWAAVGPGAGWVAHAQAAMTAADADIDYRNFNTVLVVSQSVGAPGAAGTMFAWPTASIGEWNGWATADGSPSLGTIQMPNDWTARDGRQEFATASHELGHNFGLVDQYTPSVTGRNVGGWDLMHADGPLPNFSIAHKMRLGWVDAAWVRGFNYASAGTPVDETVTLVPASSGMPAAGRFVGVEVRVTDGLNYYFEYRRNNTAQIADAALPTNDRVLGTDVRSGSYVAPMPRPDLLLLPNDADGDGPVLGIGANYKEDDNYPVQFRADASALNGTTASLRVRYGVNDKPDPSIRPWGAPPWQTPDIEVRNARNATDAAWFNVPWEANPNTVVAKVANSGLLNAPAVTVNFYVKDYTVSNAPETLLGSDMHDIAPGATVEFTANWTPATAGHFCIVVRIPPYVRPGTPAVAEVTELNNVAQSNYDRYISPINSPAERRITQVDVGHPFNRATRVYISLGQTNPLYRTYLEHKWLDLAAGERRRITVMMEYVGALPSTARPRDDMQQLMRAPNRVSMAAHAVDPHDTTRHHMVVLGGGDLEVVTGRGTRIDGFRVQDGVATGRVVTRDGQPVRAGSVIVTVETGDKRQPLLNQVAEVRDGQFRVLLSARTGRAHAYYVPAEGFGDATSQAVTVR